MRLVENTLESKVMNNLPVVARLCEKNSFRGQILSTQTCLIVSLPEAM